LRCPAAFTRLPDTVSQQCQRGWKLYSFHAPETECIGKANAPYELGVKVSIVTTNARAPGGQFVLHATVFPGNPYDGHSRRSDHGLATSGLPPINEHRLTGPSGPVRLVPKRRHSHTRTN